MLTIGAVSYLNTLPYLLGLNTLDTDRFEIIADYPSLIASQFFMHTIDVALLPTAALKDMANYSIAAPYGIAADGVVDTVCLFSAYPIESLDIIYLDYQSRTSVMLIQILCKQYLKISPKFMPLQEDMLATYPQGKCGMLVIGDRAISLMGKFSYCYDLATLWKKFTNLPFVFALWVAHKPLKENDSIVFSNALQKGVAGRLKIINEYSSSYNTSYFSVNDYLNHKIQYHLTDEHFASMHKFLFLIDNI